MEPIAIIGMAGRFPGAADIDEFWANLVAGRDCIAELDDAEILRYHENPDVVRRADYIRRRPVFAASDAFDAKVFGMTPREAEVHDPQYRAMLETVHAVFEHGGYDPSAYPGAIGLYAATNVNRYRYDYIETRRDVVDSVGWTTIDVHNHPDYMSTFISYKLGLRGPSMTLLTACSSGLVAVHQACLAIRGGDCDMAVAGGVDIEFPYHRGYVPVPGTMFSQDGQLRAFDAEASGTVFGDGVGAVLLKSLSAALRDGDTVYATILSSAINNDGDRKVGFTAPSVAGQSECVRRALTTAGVDPAEIGYVEAHATGTTVGDPIEVTALIDAYRRLDPELPGQRVALGSVKSNIGHLGQAAGMAALIKTTLALRHRTIPPTIHVRTPNPHIDWDDSPFYLNTRTTGWPDPDARGRTAGVSSFGIGGTNAHAILREAPALPPTEPALGAQPLLWSAADGTAERALRERLAGHFAKISEEEFADAAYTLRVGRTPKKIRGAVQATGPADAADALHDPTRLLRADGVQRRVVFAFPGQGAQQPGMCRGLYEREPVFQQGCDAAFEVLQPLLGADLRALWLAAERPEDLAPTEVAQPLLYVLEYTLAHCLSHWGVAPGALVGHSLGELVAGAYAGVFDFESGLRAVAARARLMAAMPPGAMLAVAAGPDRVADLLHDNLTIATRNAADQVVLAGPADAVREAETVLAARGVSSRMLVTSHAFHHSSMADAAATFEQELRSLTLEPPRVPIVSATTGATISDAEAIDPAFWAGQLLRPVDFDAAAHTVAAAGAATVLEVGPGKTLTALLRSRSDIKAAKGRVMSTVERVGAAPVLPETLAQLWVDGVPVDYWRHEQGRRRVAVPGYPYQRKRYWLDALPQEEKPDTVRQDDPGDVCRAAEPDASRQAGTVVETASSTVTEPQRSWRLAEVEWVRVHDVPSTPATGTAVLLVGRSIDAAELVLAGLQRAGYATVRVVDRRGPKASGRRAIDPTSTDEWASLLEPVADSSTGPVVLVHAALLGADPDAAYSDELPARVEDNIAALHAAVRAATAFQRRHRRPTRLLLVGSGMVDVTGADPVDPSRALLVGLLRSAQSEMPDVTFEVLDVAGAVTAGRFSRAVAAGAPVLALRGSAVFRPTLRPVRPPAGDSRLRVNGTYLITGGLGGIGLVVARALAGTGLRPRLALLGRSGLTGLDGAARDRAEDALEDLRDAGAAVDVFACDTADVDALDAAVSAVERRFGSVNGVVHAAGVAGGGLLERRRPEEIQRVLRPKVGGVVAIERVFAGRGPLDFLALFSSQAGLSGLYGSADYAAANAFLDAYARRDAGTDRATFSVQWPGWADVGMLAASSAGQAILNVNATAAPVTAPLDPTDRVVLELARTPGFDWEFDDHVFDGTPVLPGTALLEFAVLAARADGIDPQHEVELRDTVFLAPIIGDGPREIRVLATDLGGARRFRVQSRIARSGGEWSDHATGVWDVAPDAPEVETLQVLAGRLTEEVGGPQYPWWVAFGPHWPEVVRTTGTDDERLVRLVMSPDHHSDFTDHPLHPAVLDLAAGRLNVGRPGARYAPFMYRRLAMFAPLTPDVHIHTWWTPGPVKAPRSSDLDLYDTVTGRLLARVEGFTMREVKGSEFAMRGWNPAPADTSGLLSPRDGAEVFLDLLRGDPPPVVVVDLVDAPLRVPGVEWAGEPTVPATPVPVPATTVAPPPAAPAPVPASTPTASSVPSGDPVLDGLRRLWGDALGVTDIAADADFFDLGGNSLAAVQLASRINDRFGVTLPAGAVLDAPTLRVLAAEVAARRSAGER